jgi:3-oxoadipate enol-lactonase
MGGWTALGFALAEPGRARSLVLTNSLGGVATEAWVAAARQAPPPGPAVLGVHPALGRHLMDTDRAKAFLYQQLGSSAPPPAEARDSLFATAFTDTQVAGLACPVLVVASDDDRIFPNALIAASAARLPGARLTVIAGAGHSTYFEQPDAWNAVVDGFLATVP